MADEKLFRESITFVLAFKEAFANWEEPTSDELNNTELAFNITCALDESGTNFDLDAPDTDDSLSFCQAAGSEDPTFDNPNIVFQAFRSRDKLEANTANLAFQLLGFADLEYFAIMRKGHAPDAPFAADQVIRMASVMTDNPVDVIDVGENVRIQNNFLPQGDVLWGYRLAA